MIMSDSPKKLEYPYLAVIPYAVMSDKKLTPYAKLHFGCLAALSKKEGYCFASDKQLAEMHQVDERQISRWHKSLEENNHIVRDTYNVSYRDDENRFLWKAKRKIYVNDGFARKSEEFAKDKNVPPIAKDKNVPPVAKGENVRHKEESSKEESSKEEKGKAASSNKDIPKEKKSRPTAPLASEEAHFCSKYLFDKLKKMRPDRRVPNFKAWAIEFDSMIRCDGISKENIIKAINWKFDTDNKFVIESPATLRKKYERIADNMQLQKDTISKQKNFHKTDSPAIHVADWSKEEEEYQKQMKEYRDKHMGDQE